MINEVLSTAYGLTCVAYISYQDYEWSVNEWNRLVYFSTDNHTICIIKNDGYS